MNATTDQNPDKPVIEFRKVSMSFDDRLVFQDISFNWQAVLKAKFV